MSQGPGLGSGMGANLGWGWEAGWVGLRMRKRQGWGGIGQQSDDRWGCRPGGNQDRIRQGMEGQYGQGLGKGIRRGIGQQQGGNQVREQGWNGTAVQVRGMRQQCITAR